jgi:phage shock protein PspC (stress-responsive transcriptional regulator)
MIPVYIYTREATQLFTGFAVLAYMITALCADSNSDLLVVTDLYGIYTI